jgi:two-component system chemotaxis sensor kinase CheA
LLEQRGAGWAAQLPCAIEGLHAIHGLLGGKMEPAAQAAAAAMCEVLHHGDSGDDSPDEPTALPCDGATVSFQETLHEVAIRMVRSEPEDPVAMGELVNLLAAARDASELSAHVRDDLDALVTKLSALAYGASTTPQADFSEATRLMDHLNMLTAEESAAETAGNEPPAGGPASTEPPAYDSAAEIAPAASSSEASAPSPEPAAWILTEEMDAALVADFVMECSEYTQGAEAALLELEGDPEHTEAINTVFRAFHTIKGTSGFLGIDLLSELAHKAENLLSRMRDKQIRCVGGYADLALRANDGVKALIDGVRQALGGSALVKPAGYDDLIRILENPEASGINENASEAPACGVIEEFEEGDLAETEFGDAAEAGEPARESGAAADRRANAGSLRVAQVMQGQKAASRAGSDDSSVRVRTDRLDRLIDMVGELVIAHSMVSEDGDLTGGSNPDLVRKVAHSSKIVRELQDLSMSMRMVPLKATFLKMARLIRDLTHKNDRQVVLHTSGEETEIDRNMVDILADPLIHMIRNAVDHGIEPPDVRVRAGKDRIGIVTLSAYHAGGNVVVELRDDGRGLDRERIAQKAIERGLIESDKGMSDSDVFSLIFEAGFSTADKITEVSGRGVGMDVVRRAVQSLRGRIEIQSELGRGTTFVIKLPLTLAVTDGMLIRVGKQRFILPTASIQMSFRPDAAAVKTVLGRGELVVLRSDLIPIVRLHQVFSIPGAIESPTEALFVIIADGERQSAVLVDEILGQQQVVAKSLGEGTGKVAGVAGGAILGDGRVGLILDPSGLIGLARGGSNWEHRAVLEAVA